MKLCCILPVTNSPAYDILPWIEKKDETRSTEHALSQYNERRYVKRGRPAGGSLGGGLQSQLQGLPQSGDLGYPWRDIGELIDEISEKFPSKTIWLYTGYDWEAIRDLPLIRKVDVVVDGEFVEALKDANLHWKGSSNQRVIDVQPSLLTGEAVLHCS